MAKSLGKMRNAHGRDTGLTHIKDLVPDPANRRAHNPRNIGMVVDALQAVGAARSIVIDEDNVVLAGNGVTEAAAEAGITKVQVVEVDGSTLVAVRRKGLTAEQKRALAIYDNRTGELATWDFEQLQADKDAGLSLQPFWTAEEEKKLLRSITKQGLTDPDDVPAERSTGIVTGDLFELGAHRLLCGDCTVQGDVERLMGAEKPTLVLTDPPYPKEFDDVWVGIGALAHRACADDAFLVSLCGHYQLPMVINQVIGGGWVFYWIAIAENNNQPIMHGFSVKCSFKPCIIARKGAPMARRIWIDNFALRTKTQDWQASQKEHKWGQATALFYEPLEAFCDPADGLVYEPFCGGGTTMIACELYNVACRAIEILPPYCQVIIDRWESFTGQKAQKVGEAVRA